MTDTHKTTCTYGLPGEGFVCSCRPRSLAERFDDGDPTVGVVTDARGNPVGHYTVALPVYTQDAIRTLRRNEREIVATMFERLAPDFTFTPIEIADIIRKVLP